MNLKKNYRYLLVLSLCLIALGTALTTLFNTEQDAFNAPINKFLKEMPWLFVVFYVALIGPIMEEIAFRSWACKKKYWTWISFVTSSIYVLTINIYAGIIYPILFLTIIFFFRNKPKHRLFSFLILTSISFASMHYENLQARSFLFAFPQYLGLGLLFAYFALRFNLFVSMLAHIINNSLALFLLGFFSIPEKPIQLENESYTATLTNISFSNNFNRGTSSMFHGDYIDINKYTIGSIASSLLEEGEEKYYIHRDETESYKQYNLYAKQKDTNILINQKELLLDFCRIKNLKIDTIQEKKEVYILSVNDISKIKHKKEHDNNKSNMVTTIFGLCSMLSENSLFSSDKVETIVIPNKNLKNEYISIDYNKIHFSKTFEEKQKSLATSYGITLTKKETIVNVIRIREKK